MEDGLCFKLNGILRTLYKALKSLTGLIIILVLYNIIGAIIFVELEGQNEMTNTTDNVKNNDLVRLLSNITAALASPELESLRNQTLSMIDQLKDNTGQPEKTWDFWRAMFFCGTIYTTIGYGNIIPKTDAGKIVAIFYAVFGIPLAMKVLAVLGKKLSVILKFVYTRFKRGCRHKRNKKYSVTSEEKEAVELKEKEAKEKDPIKIEQEENEEQIIKEAEDHLPIALPIVILVIYILLGGVMYTFWEDWGYLDAFYFVFISISTIGFGDITPDHTKYFIVTSIYVFIGLALVSMCINVIIDLYIMSLKIAVHQMKQVKLKMVAGCGCGSDDSV